MSTTESTNPTTRHTVESLTQIVPTYHEYPDHVVNRSYEWRSEDTEAFRGTDRLTFTVAGPEAALIAAALSVPALTYELLYRIGEVPGPDLTDLARATYPDIDEGFKAYMDLIDTLGDPLRDASADAGLNWTTFDEDVMALAVGLEDVTVDLDPVEAARIASFVQVLTAHMKQSMGSPIGSMIVTPIVGEITERVFEGDQNKPAGILNGLIELMLSPWARFIQTQEPFEGATDPVDVALAD